MDTNKILIGGLIGFAVTFILAYLFYGVLLQDFFASNGGSATGVMRSEENMLWIPLVLGHITLGLLLSIILGRWAGISTLSSGAMAGALIGFLVSMTYAMISLGTTNIANLTASIADVAVTTLNSTIACALIAMYFGSTKK